MSVDLKEFLTINLNPVNLNQSFFSQDKRLYIKYSPGNTWCLSILSFKEQFIDYFGASRNPLPKKEAIEFIGKNKKDIVSRTMLKYWKLNRAVNFKPLKCIASDSELLFMFLPQMYINPKIELWSQSLTLKGEIKILSCEVDYSPISSLVRMHFSSNALSCLNMQNSIFFAQIQDELKKEHFFENMRKLNAQILLSPQIRKIIKNYILLFRKPKTTIN